MSLLSKDLLLTNLLKLVKLKNIMILNLNNDKVEIVSPGLENPTSISNASFGMTICVNADLAIVWEPSVDSGC